MLLDFTLGESQVGFFFFFILQGVWEGGWKKREVKAPESVRSEGEAEDMLGILVKFFLSYWTPPTPPPHPHPPPHPTPPDTHLAP